MPQISHIKYSNVIEAGRFDADFFKPEYLFLEEKSKDPNFCSFADLHLHVDASAFYPSIEPFYNAGDIPFLRVADVDGIINYEQAVHLPRSIIEKFNTLKLAHPGDIVITKGGSVARVGYVNKVSALSRDLIFINSSKLEGEDAKFLYFYFLSKFANKLLLKTASLTSQPHLTIGLVKKLPIFFPEENIRRKISSLYDLLSKSQQQSKQLYQEAEELLLTELGLKDHSFSHDLTFATTKKEVDQAGRYDAEYFQPKYDEILEKIDQYQGGWDFVENIFEYKKGFEPGTEAYVEEGKNFVRVSDFSKFGLEGTDKKISEEMFDELKDNYAPQKGEILFTKDGTIGISYLLKEDVEGILSGAFLRLQLKEAYKAYDKECLTLILNSIICSLQVERFSGGALIAHLKPSDFQKLKLPLIDPQIQQLISAKVQESFRLRNESKQLLEQAKKMVEDEIEKE